MEMEEFGMPGQLQKCGEKGDGKSDGSLFGGTEQGADFERKRLYALDLPKVPRPFGSVAPVERF